ncbi:MAG: PSD1 and planctomycete cytochrome C domain-containing protein [Bacteroidia bacterium]|nr:PSD1 and planctomycete cytochrome C domain-containing protein [Bacteroidia bacterium]
MAKAIKIFSWPYLRWWMPLVVLLAAGFVVKPWGREKNFPGLPETPDYNYHIRPILSANCYVCHGPDSSSREANLRLDNFADATAPLEDGGFAIVPGNAARSELLRRVSSHDPDLQMPPPKAKKVLSETEIELLRRWIDKGAEWKTHWSFIPPEKPRLPRKLKKAGATAVVDYFIEKELENRGLTPSPEADKNVQIRRLSYLLTGLPPTPEEVSAFLSDSSDNAYEKVVDRLLDSPHFGERWARHWMDLVRYAESMGHEFDYNVGGAWHYRDYLIRAFNEDVPYNQLVVEHLAGDMLTSPRLSSAQGFNESVIGTAFFYMGEGKHSPVSIKQEEADRIDNMIDVTSKTFQGLTVGCARCHDHKFDPIPTTDYYAMYGMLESARFTPQPIGQTAADEEILAMLDRQQTAIRQKLGEQMMESLDKLKPLTPLLPPTPLPQTPTPKPKEQMSEEGNSYKILGDFRKGDFDGWYSNGFAFGDKPVGGKFLPDTNSCCLTAVSPPSASMRKYGPGIHGALRSPNFTINHDFIEVRAAGKNSIIRTVIDNFQLIQWPIYGDISKTIESEEMTNYRMDVAMWKGHKAYIEILPGLFDRHTYSLPSDAWAEVEYATAWTGTSPEMEVPRFLANIDPAVAVRNWMAGTATSDELHRINELLKNKKIQPSFKSVKKEVESWYKLTQKVYRPGYIIGFTEGDSVFSPVFIRGKVGQYSEFTVPHQFLYAISKDEKFSQKGSGRMAWAAAVTDPSNPLTSRVMVNRIWHYLFGRGIVETVDNFGLQGKLPTHPELLDYLAVNFVEEGWSMKKTIRHLVLSQAFRRSSEVISPNENADPENLSWHHFPVRRLEAEAIRDGILAISGCLDSAMFGHSVPIHLTPFMTGRGRPDVSGPLDGSGRRSIYLAIRRNFLSPMMLVFDMPMPFSTFGNRNVTNVPAQSLTLMNDPFVQEEAGYWAEKLLSTPASQEARIRSVYQQAFSREPTEEEKLQAENFLEKQADYYRSKGREAEVERQVWSDYCHTIFNLKEFIHLL